MPQRRAKGEGTVYFEPTRARWVGAVHIDGKRRKVVGSTKTEARTKLNELLRKDQQGLPVGDGNITVAALITRWRDRELAGRQVAPSTRASLIWATNHLADAIGGRRVRSLRVEDVEAAFDLLAAEGLGRASLVKLRSALNQVLAFGVRRGLAPRNIALEVILPSAATGRSKRSSLDVDQVRVLLDALRGERLGAMFALSVTVGLRPGEAAGLTWRAVDLSSRTIRVASAVRLDGSRPLVVEDLKTNASARTLAIPSLVVDMLQNHSAQQRLEQATAESWQQPQLVFTTRAGTPLSPSNVRRELDRVLRKAGLPRISPNELRHTAASVLSDQGVPLEDIADVLGHTNTRMLSQTYRHQLKPSVGAAAAAMDRLFDGRGT